jgi:hypothetical protein
VAEHTAVAVMPQRRPPLALVTRQTAPARLRMPRLNRAAALSSTEPLAAGVLMA